MLRPACPCAVIARAEDLPAAIWSWALAAAKGSHFTSILFIETLEPMEKGLSVPVPPPPGWPSDVPLVFEECLKAAQQKLKKPTNFQVVRGVALEEIEIDPLTKKISIPPRPTSCGTGPATQVDFVYQFLFSFVVEKPPLATTPLKSPLVEQPAVKIFSNLPSAVVLVEGGCPKLTRSLWESGLLLLLKTEGDVKPKPFYEDLMRRAIEVRAQFAAEVEGARVARARSDASQHPAGRRMPAWLIPCAVVGVAVCLAYYIRHRQV
jgi:hypothetical protein